MKRFLSVLVLLALVSALVPRAAFAEGAMPFQATANICLLGLPTVEKMKETPKGMMLTTTEEVLAGEITSSEGWEGLVGTQFTVTVTKEKSLFEFATNTFSGDLKGEFTITTPGGAPVLAGQLKGAVEGAFADPTAPVLSVYQSSALVKWSGKGDDASAKGVAQASFGVTADCLAYGYGGTITFSGVRKARE